MTPTDYANDTFPPDQDALLPASHDWNHIREQVADAIRQAIGDTRRALLRVPDHDPVSPGRLVRSYTLKCGICGYIVTYVVATQKEAEAMARENGWLKTELVGWRCPYSHWGMDRYQEAPR